MLLLGSKKVTIEELIQIDKSLLSVPPVQTYTMMTGKLTMMIKMDYINLPFQKHFQFRYSLWGSSEKLYFFSNKSQLKTTASIQLLSRYFWDMNLLCIQVVSTMQSNSPLDPILTNRIKSPSSLKSLRNGQLPTQQKKIVGYVYVPLRKYFINHTMSNFSSEKFAIIDQNKKRIGEIGMNFNIDMLENNGMSFKNYLNKVNSLHSYQHLQNKNIQTHSRQKHQVSIMDKNSIANRFSYDETETFTRLKQKKVTISDRPHMVNENKENLTSQVKNKTDQQKLKQNQLIQKRYSKKNYFSYQDINLQDSDKQIINQAEQIEQNKKSVNARLLSKKKSVKSNVKNQIQKISKAEHTDLSVIRMKWGTNHPTVQLMKLRLDEAKYLDSSTQPSIANSYKIQQQQFNRINFYLKQFTSLSGKNFAQSKYLSLAHVTKDSKMIFKTQINLQNLVKNAQNMTITLNHLIMLNEVQMTDKINVQTADSHVEISILELLNSNILDLRKKDNRKRVYELKYQINCDTESQNAQKQKQIQNIQPNKITQKPLLIKKKLSQQILKKQTHGGSKTKQINRIINQGQKKIQSKSKTKKIKIIPENQNGQHPPQQQLKSTYHKLLSMNEINNNKNQQHQINFQKLLSSTFKYFELFYLCEDESCFQIVTKLLGQDKIKSQQQNTRLLNQLDAMLRKMKENDFLHTNSLYLIVQNLYRSNFKSFYKCFQSYKQINQKYQTVLYKLKKFLYSSFQGQVSFKRESNILMKIGVILDYVKKHKKDKITFGLISYNDLFQIILLKFQPSTQEMTFNPKISKQQEKINTQKSQLQLQKNDSKINQVNNDQVQIFKFIEAFLTLFTRYEKDYIKISQIQTNIQQFIKLQENKKVQIVQLNMNLGILLNLHMQVTKNESEQNYQKYFQTFLYHFIQENKVHIGLNIQQSSFQNKHKTSIYKLLFQDPLSLEDIKSSIHFSQTFKNQQQEYQLMTEQDARNQRYKTQENKSSFSKIRRQQQQIIYGYGERLRTEEMMRGEKNRLNTEDQNVIEFMNLKKNDIRSITKENQGTNLNQYFSSENQQVIGIQVTKKEQFLSLEVQKPQQKEINKLQQNKFENDDSILTQQKVFNKAQTKYLSIKCSLIKPSQIGRDKKWLNQDKNNQVINLFYRYQKIDQVQKTTDVQQFKLQAKQTESIAKIVPNIFYYKNQKMIPVQQFIFRIESSPIKMTKLVQNSIQKIIKVKNIIGKQQYPIQDVQGKIIFIIEIQIQEVDQFQQQQFQKQKQSQILAKNLTQKYSDKFNHLRILNINKLFCLNLIKPFSCLRLIYETQNQIQVIKDIQQFGQDKNYVQNEQSQNIKNSSTRMLPINVDFIKIKNQKRSTQKHIIKIFNVKKLPTSKTNKEDLTQIKQNPINKFKSRTSQPVSRFLDEDIQNTHSDMKNVPLDLICQFQFTLNQNLQSQRHYGISRQNKWLIDGPYRLQVDLFDIQYEKWADEQEIQSVKKTSNNLDKLNIWQKKIQKILTVFKIQNQQKVRQRIKHYFNKEKKQQSKITYEQFLTIISETMGYRLTEKQIFVNLCFTQSSNKQIQQKLSAQQKLNHLTKLFSLDQIDFKLFNENKKSNISSVKALYEQFQTFDLQHQGLLSFAKFEVLKKIMPELNFLPLEKFTVDLSKNKQNQYINDCKVNSRDNKKPIIDYLGILWECRKSYQQNLFFENLITTKKQFKKQQQNPNYQNRQEIPNKKITDQSLPQYYRITIKQFENLMLNGIPCTLQFKLDNKKLFNPIYRCYSHEFSQDNWSVIKLQKQKAQTYTLKIFNRLVSTQNKRMKQDLYQYKMLQEFDLRNLLQDANKNKFNQKKMIFELKCQNLDGVIKVQVQCLNSKEQYEYFLKEQREKNHVDFSSQDEQKDIRRLEIQGKNKYLSKQIQSDLKRQFYEDQESQNQQFYQRQITKPKNQSKYIGQSVIKAFNIESNKKGKQIFQEKLRLQRDQSLLSQTRKQWQTILSKNIDKNELDEEDEDQFKQDRLQQVLKKEIKKEELNKKFQLFKGDGFSDSSEDEIESD